MSSFWDEEPIVDAKPPAGKDPFWGDDAIDVPDYAGPRSTGGRPRPDRDAEPVAASNFWAEDAINTQAVQGLEKPIETVKPDQTQDDRFGVIREDSRNVFEKFVDRGKTNLGFWWEGMKESTGAGVDSIRADSFRKDVEEGRISGGIEDHFKMGGWSAALNNKVSSAALAGDLSGLRAAVNEDRDVLAKVGGKLDLSDAGWLERGLKGAAASGVPMIESAGIGVYAGAIPFVGPVTGKSAVGAYWQQQGAGDFLRSFLRDKDVDALTPEKLKEYNQISQAMAVPYAAIEFAVSAIPGMKSLGSSVDQQIAGFLFRKVAANPTVMQKIAKSGTAFAIRWAMESLLEEGGQGATGEAASQMLDSAAKGDQKSILKLVGQLDAAKIGQAFKQSGIESVPSVGIITALGGGVAGAGKFAKDAEASAKESAASRERIVVNTLLKAGEDGNVADKTVRKQEAAAINAEREIIKRQRQEMLDSLAYDPEAERVRFDAKDALLKDQEAEAGIIRAQELTDPNSPQNLKTLTEHVQKTEGVSEAEAMKRVAATRGEVRRQLLADINGIKELPAVEGERQRVEPPAPEAEEVKQPAQPVAGQPNAAADVSRGGEQSPPVTGAAEPSFYVQKETGKPFADAEQAGRALEANGLIETHEVVEVVDGGFVLVKKPAEVLADYPDLQKPFQGSESAGSAVPSGAADLATQGRAAQQGGFVAVPNAEGVQRAGGRMVSFLKRYFLPQNGMDKATRTALLEYQHSTAASRVEGMFTQSVFKNALKKLRQTNDKAAVNDALQKVVYGEMTPEQFRQQFNLPTNNRVVYDLYQFNKVRSERSEKIAGLLEKAGKSDLADTIRKNESYVSRFYLKHALGDEFVPERADYEAAVDHIKAGFDEAIDSFSLRVGKAAAVGTAERSQGASAIDVPAFLRTGADSLLVGVSPSRAAELQALRRQFQQLSAMIDLNMQQGGTNVAKNLAAIDSTARSIVDFYLSRESSGSGSGKPDVSNLKHRFLGDAFRRLYGEVTDPIYTSSVTSENQARMVAQLAFFNRLALDAEGKSWTRQPDRVLRTMLKLGSRESGSDRLKYGELAGSYVTKELHNAIHGFDFGMPVPRVIQSVNGTMRLLKLYGPKTIIRNYATALTGFALGSGDMFQPGYWKYFGQGNALVRGFAAREPRSLAVVSDLVNAGVFSFRGNTQMEEVQRLLSKNGQVKADSFVSKLGDLYSLIDLPSKAASYWTNLDRFRAQGMAELDARKAAAEHVGKFYQNPDALNQAVRELSKVPLSDFAGYFFDSIRIRGNQAAHAAQSAVKGDLLPAVGMSLSLGLSYGLANAFGELGKELWLKGRQWWRKEDKNIQSDELLSGADARAFRNFLPDYYRDAPLVIWKETMKDGTVKMFYTVTGGNGAFPLEDMLLGAFQDRENMTDFAKRFGRSVVENRFGPGMLASSAYTFVTGDALQGGYKSPGITDTLGVLRPDKNEIYRNAALRLVADIYGGQIGSKIMQSWSLAEQQKYGLEPKSGSYAAHRTHTDIWGSLLDVAKTYEIRTDEAAKMMRNTLGRFNEGVLVSKGMIATPYRAEKKFGGFTEAQFNKAVSGTQAREQYMKDVHEIVKDAWKSFGGSGGVIDIKIVKAVLEDSIPGLNEQELLAVIKGFDKAPVYVPKPKPNSLQKLLDGMDR